MSRTVNILAKILLNYKAYHYEEYECMPIFWENAKMFNGPFRTVTRICDNWGSLHNALKLDDDSFTSRRVASI